MVYNLNEYHRNLSKEELINDLKRISVFLHKSYISRSEYETNGKYSASPYLRCFGSWTNALSAAGLETHKNKNDYKIIPDNYLIEDMKKVSTLLNKESVSTKDYSMYGKYKVQTILSRFSSWSNALNIAGLKPTSYKEITDVNLFDEIERLWINKGSQPTTTDIKNGLSKYSLNTYSRRFGGWRNALKAFLDYMNEEYVVVKKDNPNKSNTVSPLIDRENEIKQSKHRTPREPNLKLRFCVFQRDNFKCCICGRSPAISPGLELHVDHIKPWAKGGETTLDNLQTLCIDCNLGKSDTE